MKSFGLVSLRWVHLYSFLSVLVVKSKFPAPEHFGRTAAIGVASPTTQPHWFEQDEGNIYKPHPLHMVDFGCKSESQPLERLWPQENPRNSWFMLILHAFLSPLNQAVPFHFLGFRS